MSDIQERLLKYRDALVTGDPDRQLREGADVEIINDAVARIAALGRQLTELRNQYQQHVAMVASKERPAYDEQQKRIAELKHQLAEAQQDAERLDNLVSMLKGAIFHGETFGNGNVSTKSLTRFIDAAIGDHPDK